MSASILENMVEGLGFGDVAALVEAGADVNETDGLGCSALFLSSEQGNVQVVTELIAANANVNQANNDGATPLHMACQLRATPRSSRRCSLRTPMWTRRTTMATPR